MEAGAEDGSCRGRGRLLRLARRVSGGSTRRQIGERTIEAGETGKREESSSFDYFEQDLECSRRTLDKSKDKLREEVWIWLCELDERLLLAVRFSQLEFGLVSVKGLN